jgi:hypothetical protein
MNMYKAIALFLIGMASPVLKADPLFTLSPSDGAIKGGPGQTIGWGFTITPDASLWTNIVGTVLIGETNPFLGSFTDFVSLQGGPSNGSLPPASGDWIQSFDAFNGSGFGAYTISPTAAIGDTNSGLFLILYERFSADPSSCGGCFVDSNVAFASFSVQAVPEPATSVMMALAGAALLTLRSALYSKRTRSRLWR